MTARALESGSPAGAIGYRPNDRARLWPLLLLSIALHLAVALGLAWVLSRHFGEKREVALDPGIDVTLGEAAPELVVAQPSPEPIPPPPPPSTEPAPPPPEPPPVPMEKPELIEMKTPPKAGPKAAPKREQSKTPAGAKIGAAPRAGVIGGKVTESSAVGSPGGQKIGDQGWRTPKPPYPRAALAAHIQGDGEVRITTDAAGNVKEAVITRSIAPILDSNTRWFARENWKGPPNATRTVPVIYRIP